MRTLALNSHTDATYGGAMRPAARGPVVVIRVDGDEFLSRLRGLRKAVSRGLSMARKVARMWYL